MIFKSAALILPTLNLLFSSSTFARPIDKEETSTVPHVEQKVSLARDCKNDECLANCDCCDGFKCKKKKCKAVPDTFELFKILAGGETDGYNGEKLELGYGLEMSASGNDLIFPPYKESEKRQTFLQTIDYERAGMTTTVPQDPKMNIFIGEADPDSSYVSDDYWRGAISGNGRIIAIGDRYEDNDKGALRTYEWNGAWNELSPSPIKGSTKDEEFPSAVALSGDGYVMVACETSGDSYCQRYVLESNGWTEQGAAITGGDSPGDLIGQRMVMDIGGNRIAVSSPLGTFVRVYDWNSDDENWSKVWTFKNDGYTDSFGYHTIQISDDGKIIAIGDEMYSGKRGVVVVYKEDDNAATVEFEEIFKQKGPASTKGCSSCPYYGYAFAMSGDGKTLALSDYEYSDKPKITIYKKKKNSYKKYQAFEKEGYQTDRVRLNEAGTVVAFENNPYYDSNKGEIFIWKAEKKKNLPCTRRRALKSSKVTKGSKSTKSRKGL